MRNGIRRAFQFDIRLCEDPACGHVHLVMCDEDKVAFAEFLFEPEFAGTVDFINALIHACRDAQQRGLPRIEH